MTPKPREGVTAGSIRPLRLNDTIKTDSDRRMILRPNENVWRIERTNRAAVLIDAAAYFGAVRAALLRAQHTVFIVGWDIHSRTRLVGDAGAQDGYPECLGDSADSLGAQSA